MVFCSGISGTGQISSFGTQTATSANHPPNTQSTGTARRLPDLVSVVVQDLQVRVQEQQDCQRRAVNVALQMSTLSGAFETVRLRLRMHMFCSSSVRAPGSKELRKHNTPEPKEKGYSFSFSA